MTHRTDRRKGRRRVAKAKRRLHTSEKARVTRAVRRTTKAEHGHEIKVLTSEL